MAELGGKQFVQRLKMIGILYFCPFCDFYQSSARGKEGTRQDCVQLFGRTMGHLFSQKQDSVRQSTESEVFI